MRTVKLAPFLVLITALFSMSQVNPTDDPTKKFGAFVGKWETEGAFTSGQKTSTSLECRWSPQGSIWSAINWSEWERPAIIASSRFTRITATPANTHTSRSPIPAQSRLLAASRSKAISEPMMIPALPRMARPR